MKKTLHASLLALAIGLMPVLDAQAQIGTQLAVPNSPEFERAANRLRSAPSRQYNFSKAVLGDIMRLMAEDAGISFFGLPEGATGADRIVTFTINASPFTALETLSKANGISLIFENDIWYLRPADDTELVGRIYEINYNSQELVRKNDQGGGSLGGSSGGSSSGGNSGTSSIGLNLQGAPNFFVTEPSRLLEDIRGILDLQTNGVSATFAPTTSVDNINRFALSGLQGQPDVVVRTPQGEGGESPDGNQAKVIWNSDANTLYVVATRQQHQWVEGYLAAADQPQSLIAVEVKFLEINKNPRRDLGIDWTGVLSSNGSGGYGASLFNNEDSGAGVIDTALNLDRLGDYVLPTAILSYDDLQLRLNALFQDQRNRTVSYPRMVTLDNREVAFRSVVNQPVLSSQASASLGAGATQTSAVEYVPIGTVINILPKKMANNKLLLNVSVTVSDIVGSETINGNPFPIATSRVYTAPITVESGYTVAISGLDKASTEETKTGVPVLGRIPILGYAFKKRGKAKSNQHLMMLITPVLMNEGDPGVGKRPITRNPWKNTPVVEEQHTQIIPEHYEPRTNADLERYGKQPMASATPVAKPSAESSMIAEATPKERKGLRIFGKRKTTVSTIEAAPIVSTPAAPIVAPPAANVTEIATAAPVATPERLEMPKLPASSPSNSVVAAASTPPVKSAPKTVSAEKDTQLMKAGPPAPIVAEAPKKAPVEALGPKATSVDSTAAQKIITAAKKVENDLGKIPSGDSRLSPDDGQIVRNSYDESKRLLSQIEKLRQSKDVPMEGEISDAWWKLVAAKSKAVKISQRSPQSLAIITADGE